MAMCNSPISGECPPLKITFQSGDVQDMYQTPLDGCERRDVANNVLEVSGHILKTYEDCCDGKCWGI